MSCPQTITSDTLSKALISANVSTDQLLKSLREANISADSVSNALLETQKFTEMDLNEIYGDGLGKLPLLPMTSPGSGDRDESGLLTQKAADEIIQSLIRQGIVPTYNGKNERVVKEKQQKVLENAKEEFDFYYIRYQESLKRLFENVNLYNLNQSSDNKSKVDDQLKLTKMLNIKLNDLTQLTIALSNYIQSNSQQLEQDLPILKNKLEKQKEKLAYQHKLIFSGDAVTKLNKEMVRYSEEKARYTDNLLKVYSVLNVVALGLLVYVFRSTTD